MAYIEIALAALIAGTLDTVAGFGGGLLLIPVLVLVVGSVDAVLLSAIIPIGWNLPRIMLLREWIDWKNAGWFSVGFVPGSIVASQFLERINPEIVRTGIGVLLLVFGSYHVMRIYFDVPHLRMRLWALPLVGVIAGAVGAILGAGNGPLTTVALDGLAMQPRAIVATNGLLGGIGAVSRFVGYLVSGSLHEALWLPGLVGLAAATAGSLIGIRLARRAKDATLELVIGVAVLLAGIKMLI